MRRLIEWMLLTTLAATVVGCATTQPPERIQDAIATMNRHMPEYVEEANVAIEAYGHPDVERLCGIGIRLRDGMDTLNRWAWGEMEGEAE